MPIDPETMRRAVALAGAFILTPPAACALAYRLHHGRWPWATVSFRRPLRDRIRAELRRAGLTRGGCPHLPTILAAVAVAECGQGVSS